MDERKTSVEMPVTALKPTEEEATVAEKPIPTGENYREAVKLLTVLQEERDKLFNLLQTTDAKHPDRQMVIDRYNEANRKAITAKQELVAMQAQITTETNAVPYGGGALVKLESGTSQKGNRFIRVAEIYSSNGSADGIQKGATFTPDLTNAPKNFRETMYKGPFLVNFDGTLDVEKRYDQIPATE